MSPPPDLPKRKAAAPPPQRLPEEGAPAKSVEPRPTPEELEGIDLSDFEEPQGVAGLDLRDDKVVPPPSRPAPAAPAVAPTPPSLPPEGAPVAPRPVRRLPPAPAPEPAAPAPAAREEPPAPATPTLPEPATVAPEPAIPAFPPPPTVPAPWPAGGPPSYYGAPYGAPPSPYYPTPYPLPYGYSPAPVYYAPPVVYTLPPAPPPRVWNTREGLMRMNSAAATGVFVFLLSATLRVFEAATGVTDAPGSHQTAPLGMQALALLIEIGLGLALGVTILVGVSGLYRLGKGSGEFGDSDPAASRRAYRLLLLGAVLPAAAAAGGWFYLDGVQHALPGSGTGSDFGIARLWENYRVVVLAAALAGLAGAFCFVKGLETPLRVLRAAPRPAYRLFALEFVAAAALNAALVLVTFFAVLSPPLVGVPASPPDAMLLLMPGPVVAAHALIRLRTHLAGVVKEVERMAREKSAAPAAPSQPAPPGFA